MTITKAKLAEAMLAQFGIDYQESYHFVDVFFQELSHGLIEDQQLKLAGLGSFHVKSKTKRVGRNPKTGEAHEISARKVISFTISPTLKLKMNQE